MQRVKKERVRSDERSDYTRACSPCKKKKKIIANSFKNSTDEYSPLIRILHLQIKLLFHI